MTNQPVIRIVAIVVLVFALFGLAGGAYRAGFLQGAGTDLTVVNGENARVMPYGSAFLLHRPFGFGFFGILATLFFFLLALGAMRWIFWGYAHPYTGRHWMRHARMWGCYPAYYSGMPDRECGDVPGMVEEWHRKMHEKSSASSEPEKKEADSSEGSNV